ncbi:hypothetical protein GYB22_11820 [bacterium]|nr:hypothetical protein [bacterium]
MKKLFYILTLSAFVFTACEEKPPEPPVVNDGEEVQEMTVTMSHTFDGADIELTSGEYVLPGNHIVNITRVSYILSNFYLVKSNDEKVMLEDQYALLQPRNGDISFTLKDVPKGDYKAVGFSLGLDSAINHGDPNQYPVDHPLSSVNNSLHWSWVGGYIFIALEGKDVNSSESFVFHIAGSQNMIDYELPISFTKGNKAMNADFELMYEEIFSNPQTFDIGVDGMSTHSTTDPVTLKLVGNMGDMFKVNSVVDNE